MDRETHDKEALSLESAPEEEKAWLEEAQRRLADYRAGRTQSVSAEAVFGSFEWMAGEYK
jgi:hypothetical protein